MMTAQTKYRIRISLVVVTLIGLGVGYFYAIQYDLMGLPLLGIIAAILVVVMLFIRELVAGSRSQMAGSQADQEAAESYRKFPQVDEIPGHFDDVSAKDIVEGIIQRVRRDHPMPWERVVEAVSDSSAPGEQETVEVTVVEPPKRKRKAKSRGGNKAK